MIRVSVVIPTYNRLDRLKRVLAGLENQDYPRDQFEVVVVSDGSRDGTHEYLQSRSTSLHLVLVIQENLGPAAARNQGYLHAGGEIVLFIDDDVIPIPQLISEHLRCHGQHGENVVVIGPMLSPSDHNLSPWVSWEQSLLGEQYAHMLAGRWQATARQFYTGNTSLARRHLIESGGFDPAFRRGEDVELAYRLKDAGIQFIFNPGAIGYHYAERSFSSWLDIPYTYGKNDVIFTYQKRQSWLLPTIWREFHSRHVLIRALTNLCLDRPCINKLALGLLKQAALLGQSPGFDKISQLACSGIFNLRYYEGIAQQLGGRRAFFAGLADGTRFSRIGDRRYVDRSNSFAEKSKS